MENNDDSSCTNTTTVDLNNLTKQKLEGMLRLDVEEICNQLCVFTNNGKESKSKMIYRILALKRKRVVDEQATMVKEEKERVEREAIPIGQLYGSLPWLLIARIIGLACHDTQSLLCTCVHIAHKRRPGMFDERYAVCLPTISPDTMCDLHKYQYTNQYLQSYNFDATFIQGQEVEVEKKEKKEEEEKKVEEIRKQQCNGRYIEYWKKSSLALVSRRVFQLVSTTLFDDVVMEPTIDWWSRVVDNEYCLVKRLRRLVVMPHPESKNKTKMFHRDTDTSRLVLGGVEKMYIKAPFLVEKVDTTRLLANILSGCQSFTNLTAINLLHASINLKYLHDLGDMLKDRSVPFTKIILPCYYDWTVLPQNIKNNLEVISLHPQYEVITFKPFKQAESQFPRLRHVYVTNYKRIYGHNSLKWNGFQMPETVRKVTLNEVPDSVSPFVLNPHVETLRFRIVPIPKHEKMKKYNKKSSVKFNLAGKEEVSRRWNKLATPLTNYTNMGISMNNKLGKDRKIISNRPFVEKKTPPKLIDIPVPEPRIRSEKGLNFRDQHYYRDLILKYGVDYEKMKMDIKLNYLQRTAKEVENGCNKFIGCYGDPIAEIMANREQEKKRLEDEQKELEEFQRKENEAAQKAAQRQQQQQQSTTTATTTTTTPSTLTTTTNNKKTPTTTTAKKVVKKTTTEPKKTLKKK
ncbi:hypothetical protein DFA_00542 [Cavenderia fasciculata]|uniref:Nucleolar protein 16 n=1 Tax=Cavenderia fasciculata TaxID=261658 RepID=F4PSD5_CACFS|nr:uncharacterized protein DFA_00542 [Cavenderia fasciculata]EGG20681.1 hypothetical protein DFA_00542 [Cavenderia fasciculata]|eukprot:XP_004358531.1 hypothetical protein DFA_00542 [Cavenderia fasciculata]